MVGGWMKAQETHFRTFPEELGPLLSLILRANSKPILPPCFVTHSARELKTYTGILLTLISLIFALFWLTSNIIPGILLTLISLISCFIAGILLTLNAHIINILVYSWYLFVLISVIFILFVGTSNIIAGILLTLISWTSATFSEISNIIAGILLTLIYLWYLFYLSIRLIL